ncbi:MAG: glycine betaine ABC transporter substrate-binding protein [Mycobacterium sp.]
MRRAARLLAAVMAVVVFSGCGSSNPLGGGPLSGDLNTLIVGSADFPESKTVAELYAQILQTNGFHITKQLGIGSRETYIPAVKDHSIDLIGDYTGNLLRYFDPKATATKPDDVELALLRALDGDLDILTPSPASDADTLCVTRATADKWNLRSVADLAAHSDEVKVGAPSEFLHRSVGLAGLKANYGLDVPESRFVAISDGGGPATVKALLDGTITAANIFSTSPAIAQHDLVVLDDPKFTFPAGNLAPLVNAQKKSEKLKKVLDALSARLTTEGLTKLNAAVFGNDGVDPKEAAQKWLADQGFDKPIGN